MNTENDQMIVSRTFLVSSSELSSVANAGALKNVSKATSIQYVFKTFCRNGFKLNEAFLKVNENGMDVLYNTINS